jgi:hypothetical protein
MINSACTKLHKGTHYSVYSGLLVIKTEKSAQNFHLVIFNETTIPLLNQEECPHCRNQLVHAIEVKAENWWQVEHFLSAEQRRFER